MGRGVVTSISGPVLRGDSEDGFQLYEALQVGQEHLLAEVIHLDGNEFLAQVYEDTTGMRPGDPVVGDGNPLSVFLHPGLVGNIFDGLLRPLKREGSVVVTMGLEQDRPRLEFCPDSEPGQRLEGGARFGTATVGNRSFSCLVPPEMSGDIVYLAEPGTYGADEPVCTVQTEDGKTKDIAMGHHWPVREPRPVAARVPSTAPMITGQRILDTLFPVARGGRASLPGGFGTGKTVLQQALAMWCDADVIVYVGCGERGNEMAEVLEELPNLKDPRTGAPLMERTVIIANTSNMPVAAREASVYTAITVAEYFRDQGLHVALMADSTSRWAEALREVSGRLGELPAEAGYPAYLSSRLAEFYERAAPVTTLGGATASVTIIGAVSPPAGDFSEPVTVHTKRFAGCFWALDRDRAQARFYPAIHPLQSYSNDVVRIESWWRDNGYDDWGRDRRRLLTLLEQQARLERMARIVGQDALPPQQRLTLLCAELVAEGFLRQSAFSETDRYCSPQRQVAMLKVLMRTIDAAVRAVESGTDPTAVAGHPLFRKLQRLGEDYGEECIDEINALIADVDAAFHSINQENHAA